MIARIRNLSILMIALPASAGMLGAQAQGSVSVSAYVLPSPAMVEERGPTVETAFTMLATASLDVAAPAHPSGSAAAVRERAPSPAVISRSSDAAGYIEFAAPLVISTNVAADVMVHLAGDAAAPDFVLVQDVSGAYRRLGSGSPVPIAVGSAEPSRRRMEIRYRVPADRATDVVELPLRIVLQAGPLL